MRFASRRLATALTAITAVIGARAAQAQGLTSGAAPQFTVAASNRTAAEATARGAARRDTTVLPGDVIRYTLTFTNTVGHAVKNLELKNPIPTGLHLVAGSTHASRADARLEFSVDGGRSYSAEPMETVMVGGRAVTRPVAADRYTHVRWVVGGVVAPEAVVSAQFEARLGDGATEQAHGGAGAPTKPSGR